MAFNDFFKSKPSEVSTASTHDLAMELQKRQTERHVFPLDVFHPKIKPFISELHTKYDIPRAYIGLSMFIAYSTAVGSSYAYSTNGDDRKFMSMWGCMNGISSSGKSFAMDECLKPIFDIQDEFDKQWDDSVKGLTDEKRQHLKIKAVVYRDAYIPTLVRSILPHNPKGVLKESDEILEWINGLNAMNKKETADEQFWLSGWNGRKYSAVRSANNKIVIPRVFTNIIGGIQPKLLYKLFKNDRADSGFIFRILFASPEEHRIARPTAGYAIPYEFKEIHRKHLQKLYNELPVWDPYEDPKVCLVTQGALKLIREWEDMKAVMINGIDVNERNVHGGIMGKMKDYAYRFAALLAITDYAYNLSETECYFKNELHITGDIMARALKVAEYFYNSAVLIYEIVDNSVTAPLEVLQMATLVKMNYSISKMAEIFFNDPKKKGPMHRKLQKAIKDYPKIFGAATHT